MVQERKRMMKQKRQRAENIGEGRNKQIIDKGRALNDGALQKRKMKGKK